jgi:hypothetical protein
MQLLAQLRQSAVRLLLDRLADAALGPCRNCATRSILPLGQLLLGIFLALICLQNPAVQIARQRLGIDLLSRRAPIFTYLKSVQLDAATFEPL